MERFGNNIEDFGKFVFPRVTSLFEKTIDGQFQARGHGTKGPWKALSDDYKKWKDIHFPGKPLLEATGNMRAGLTNGSSGYAFRGTSPTVLAFGTQSVPYASYHQTGSPTLPVRPPFDFGSEFEDDLIQAMQLGVVDAARDAALELESENEKAYWAEKK